MQLGLVGNVQCNAMRLVVLFVFFLCANRDGTVYVLHRVTVYSCTIRRCFAGVGPSLRRNQFLFRLRSMIILDQNTCRAQQKMDLHSSHQKARETRVPQHIYLEVSSADMSQLDVSMYV
jgi:hypothetical protein